MWVGLVVAVLAWVVVPAAAARAQPAPEIKVIIIEASNGPGGVDPAIRHIYKRMGGSLGFSTWRLISTVRNTVPLGTTKVVLAPGNRKITLRPTAIAKGYLHVDVEILKRDARPTRVSGRLVRGGTFIVGGYPYGPGRLIFAISATF